MPGPKAPDVTPTRTLELADEGSVHVSSRPFAVVAASPEGRAGTAAEISVVFNRPMRALETEGDESPVPIRVRTHEGAAVRGHWQWLGTQAAVFVPEGSEPDGSGGHLPLSTTYDVEIPAGTRALDGSQLRESYTFSFETARPSLQLVSPSDRLKPRPTFKVVANQPLRKDDLERATRVVTGRTSLRVLAKELDEGIPGTTFELTPQGALALDAEHTLRIDKGLHGVEGPLFSEAVFERTVRTYGPLRVVGISCRAPGDAKPCDPYGGVTIEMSNPVRVKDLRAAVQVQGRVGARRDRARDDDDISPYLWVQGPFVPGGTISVSVRAGVRDEFGQVSSASASKVMRVDDLSPDLQFAASGTVFERRLPVTSRQLPVRSVNLPSYELAVGALDEVRIATLEDLSHAKKMDALRNLPRRTVKPSAARNKSAIESVSLDAPLNQQGGVVAVVARYPDHGELSEQAELYRVTDLALSAKVSRFGGVVWVTQLSSAAPVAGATVIARSSVDGSERFRAVTDAAGMVSIPEGILFQETAPIVLTARSGDDWTYRTLRDYDNVGMWPEPTAPLTTLGMLFTDRGMYRRGETVHVKTLFRDEELKGLVTPVGRTVTLQAVDIDGTTIFERSQRLGAFGETSFDVPIGVAAPLGRMFLSATIGGAEGRVVADSVLIAAYRPAEFKVTTSFGKTSYVRGDRAVCRAQGEYLFGAPMQQGSARVTWSRRPTSFRPPGHEERIVDDGSYYADRDHAAPAYAVLSDGKTEDPSVERTLDARGELEREGPLVMPEQRGAELLTCEADVMDLSRQTVANESAVVVHPASFYVALDAPNEWFVAERSTVNPTVRALEHDGRVRAGVKVHLDLIARSWSTVYEELGDMGGHYVSHATDKNIASCDVVTGAAGVSCPLAIQSAGYYLVHATAKDERGNPVGASYSLYSTGENMNVGWPMRDDASLELVADKSSYAIGQTATILVKSPFAEAEALVTVERAHTLQKFRTHVKGATPTIRVPIAADLRPNAYVTVELLRGRLREDIPAREGKGKRAFDLGGPSYRIGTVPLTVESASRRLQIAIKPARTQVGPGDTVECALDVRDASGKPVESDVTFYVVDEGVLMLSGYRTPDPLPHFSAGLPLRVASFETRAELARLLKLSPVLGEDKGYDGGGGGGPQARSDFRTTAVFTAVKTDANGHAVVRTKLPESLTTFRIMAIAAGKDDRFGSGESRVTTSRPLMVRPALPRFLRAGDHVEAGAILTAKDLPAGPVDVRAQITGGVFEGPATARVELTKGGSAEVRFRFRAEHVGPLTMSIEASGMGAHDAAKVTRNVQIPTVFETVSLSGETQKAVGEQLTDLSALRTDAGGLSLRLASTALVGVESLVDDLDLYPHGCTEQLASRLLPLAEGQELASWFGIKNKRDTRDATAEMIAEIVERQNGDGGFRYWKHSPDPDMWLSAYVTLVLARAQESGAELPKGVLERGQLFVHGALARSSVSWSERALLLDVLASTYTTTAGLLGTLHTMLPVPDDAPLFARALFAHAAGKLKARDVDREQLVKDLERFIRLTPSGAIVAEPRAGVDEILRRRLLDSDRRSAAMVLRALIELQPLHPLASKLARGLIASSANATTQDAGWILLALNEYRHQYSSVPPEMNARVFVGGTLAHEAEFRDNTPRAQTAEVSLERLLGGRSPLAFEVVGSGTLFYEARLRYARKVNPVKPLARGLSVQKFMRVVAPSELASATRSLPKNSATSADAGQLVLVDLLLINDLEQVHVVLDDPLPAGLEVLQGNLATASSSLHDALDRAEELDEYERYEPFYERRNDDDRVLTYIEQLSPGLHHYRYLARATARGTFVVPPTRAECMYEPAIMGRTAGSTFVVR